MSLVLHTNGSEKYHQLLLMINGPVKNIKLYALCNFLPYMSMNPNMSTVDGYTVNSWHVCTFRKSSVMLTAIRSTFDMFFKRLKNKSMQLLMAEPSTLAYFYFHSFKKHVNCWRYSRQHNRTFSKSANMSTVDGIAVNSWHVWIHRHIW